MEFHEIIRRPLITEKSNISREEENLVTFAVDPRANKLEIKRAVEILFDVNVITVRTMVMPRKKKRQGRTFGFKPQWKKAIVRLEEGHTIEFFEGV
ncbi:50S ribosomal protein L23 [Myxococcota bacterium]|nr:50S ribosomal protein L23 [Myxococcota bacterium]